MIRDKGSFQEAPVPVDRMPITREFVTVPKVRVGGRIDAWGSGKVVVNVSAVGIVPK